MHRSDIRRDPERWKALQELVASNVSLSEMRRTLGVDYRTVKRHFPEYRSWPVGGGGEASVVRETNRRLREFERNGRIENNRDAGFNLRRNAA